LIQPFTGALFNIGIMVPSIIQLALTEFINNGQFASHIRKMRVLYNQRRLTLLAAIDQYLGAFITPMQNNAGMHFAVKITHPKLQQLGDIKLCQHLQKDNITSRSLSAYSLFPLPINQQGILLGFAPFTDKQLTDTAQKMAASFTKLVK
ncbi:MAG: hypothetical protein HRU28_14425, partial [Rhizobiales bacterium]|nr:hypothetical protein [Hyphomicrobiales bacterium]